MKNLTKTLYFIGAMLIANHSQALIIDSFNDATPQTVSNPGAYMSTLPGTMLGGFRHLEIVSSSGPLSTSASVITTASSGILAHSEDVGTSGVSRVTWNANGTGLGGINLTQGSFSDAFLLDNLSVDQGSLEVKIGVIDTSVNTAYYTLPNITNTNTLNNTLISASFSSFFNFSNTDFTSVNEIYLEIKASQESDVTLNEIRTTDGTLVTDVPEPATFLLMGAGLVGLIGLRRRKIAK